MNQEMVSLLSRDLSEESFACSKEHREGGERAKLSHGGWTPWESVRAVQRAEQVRGQKVGWDESGLAAGGGILASRG